MEDEGPCRAAGAADLRPERGGGARADPGADAGAGQSGADAGEVERYELDGNEDGQDRYEERQGQHADAEGRPGTGPWRRPRGRHHTTAVGLAVTVAVAVTVAGLEMVVVGEMMVAAVEQPGRRLIPWGCR